MKYGISVVIRDSFGEVVAAGALRVAGAGDLIQAEAVASLEALV